MRRKFKKHKETTVYLRIAFKYKKYKAQNG